MCEKSSAFCVMAKSDSNGAICSGRWSAHQRGAMGSSARGGCLACSRSTSSCATTNKLASICEEGENEISADKCRDGMSALRGLTASPAARNKVAALVTAASVSTRASCGDRLSKSHGRHGGASRTGEGVTCASPSKTLRGKQR